MTEMIENKTFDEIKVGETASLVRAFRRDDVETWAAVTGNLNIIDLDPSPADSSMFPQGAGQAMWAAALSRRSPTPACLVRFGDDCCRHPVSGRCRSASGSRRRSPFARSGPEPRRPRLRLHRRQRQELLVGTLEVAAPREKIRHPLRDLPKVQLRREDRYLELIQMCDGMSPLRTAVVHPCSAMR